MSSTEASYDYVVIGGGSSGCIVAARLAEANAGSVLLLEAVIALAVVLACRQRGLGPLQLVACPRSRVLGLFALLFLALQVSVEWEWWPKITSRLADGVGLFALLGDINRFRNPCL